MTNDPSNFNEAMDNCEAHMKEGLGAWAASELRDSVDYARRFCESPIELLFFIGWEAVATCQSLSDYGHELAFPHRLDDEETIDNRFGASDLDVLEPQKQIGPYRVDFLITRFAYELTKTRGEEMRRRNRLIIECDGFEYHDADKKRASADRSRDRELQSQGFHVFRFSGAQLYRDNWACAVEAFDFLNKHNLRNGS